MSTSRSSRGGNSLQAFKNLNCGVTPAPCLTITHYGKIISLWRGWVSWRASFSAVSRRCLSSRGGTSHRRPHHLRICAFLIGNGGREDSALGGRCHAPKMQFYLFFSWICRRGGAVDLCCPRVLGGVPEELREVILRQFHCVSSGVCTVRNNGCVGSRRCGLDRRACYVQRHLSHLLVVR